MKIRTTLRGALLCATAFSMMLLTGCIDTDYDLGDIDMTVGVGGENINLPSDNTTQGICLDDVLDLGENNFLKVAEDGNYYIDVMDDNEFVAHMWVNQFTVPSRTYKGTYKINLGDFAPTSNMKKLQKADDDIEFNAPMVDLDFDYNYTASDITALEYIGVENGQLSISLSFANDLKTIYNAPNEEQGRANRDRITKKWSEKYPNAMKRWERDWDVITPIFKFSASVRTVIYTTNAIESLNATYRKLNRQRSVFPSDQALLKALYLATFEATKKWSMPIRNWGQVYGELSIMYEDRLPE